MPRLRTAYEVAKEKGHDYIHPLGRISIIGGLVEEFPPGSYMYVSTVCPTARERGGYMGSVGWFITDGMPPEVGVKIPWLCSCVRAEPIEATVSNTLIIPSEGPAMVGGKRSPLWRETFVTVPMNAENIQLQAGIIRGTT